MKYIFKWRNAIASKHGPKPTVRHILLTLSIHMNNSGESAFPSTRTMAIETGLSHRSIITNLEIARAEGWIIKTSRGLKGRNWKRNEYKAVIPDKVVKEMHHLKGGERVSPQTAQGGEPNARGGEPLSEGGERAVSESLSDQIDTYTNSTKNSLITNKAHSVNAVAGFYLTKSGKKLSGLKLIQFNQFWDAFDLKKGKAEAADVWLKLNPVGDTFKQIIDAAKKEAAARDGTKSPKWAQGWLSGRRFEDEAYSEKPTDQPNYMTAETMEDQYL